MTLLNHLLKSTRDLDSWSYSKYLKDGLKCRINGYDISTAYFCEPGISALFKGEASFKLNTFNLILSVLFLLILSVLNKKKSNFAIHNIQVCLIFYPN
ncbi:MAG: hypothetical protein ACK457_05040 [Flavobacteriia bacterium]|jgi:hypothetical protein